MIRFEMVWNLQDNFFKYLKLREKTLWWWLVETVIAMQAQNLEVLELKQILLKIVAYLNVDTRS